MSLVWWSHSHDWYTSLINGICHNPSPSPSPNSKAQFQSPSQESNSKVQSPTQESKSKVWSLNSRTLTAMLCYSKLKIQFQNSFQDCDKVESNSSLFCCRNVLSNVWILLSTRTSLWCLLKSLKMSSHVCFTTFHLLTKHMNSGWSWNVTSL